MVPVHQIVPEVLARIVRQAPLTPEKVAFAWRAAVGPAIDRVTTVELENRVLHVRVRDRAWRREIERVEGVIRNRLDGLLGVGVVRDMTVDVT